MARVRVILFIFLLGMITQVSAKNYIPFQPTRHLNLTIPKLSFTLRGLYLNESSALMQYSNEVSTLNGVVNKNGEVTSWSPGFALGIGYQFIENYDVQFFWTYLNFTKNFTNSNTSLMTTTPPVYYEAESRFEPLKLNYSALDLNLGHRLALLTRLSLHGFFGLRGIDFRQTRNLLLINQVNGDAAYDTHASFWGIGPRIGVDINYLLDKHWGIFANIAGGLLAGVEKNNTNGTPAFATTSTHINANNVLQEVNASLGINFTYLLANASSFKVATGYELENYNGQNNNSNSFSSIFPLSFQGPYLSFTYNL